eukprot:g24466.t1
MGLCGVVGGERSVDQGIPEGTAPAEGGQGKEGEYVFGGGISLEVVEMVSDDLLDLDAGGMVEGYDCTGEAKKEIHKDVAWEGKT